MIVLVTVVLNRTVVVDSDRRFDKPCGSHFQCQMRCITSVDGIKTLVIDLIGQSSRDVIGRLTIKS